MTSTNQQRQLQPILLILSGWSQSGKDSVADYLQNYYGFKRFAFADALKTMCCRMLNIPSDSFKTQEQKAMHIPGVSSDLSRREFSIKFAKWFLTTTGDYGYFAKSIIKELKTAISKGQNCVITDWRLPIELEVVRKELALLLVGRKLELYTVRVQRLNQTESPVQESVTEHTLDTAEFDILFQNPGTSQVELKENVDILMKKIRDIT